MLSPHQLPSSYWGWRTLIKDKPGNHKVAHNTWASYYPFAGREIDVTYHSTVIATVWPDDSVTVNTAGWQTATTKTRLNALLPGRVNICQEKYRWYFWKMVDGQTVQCDYHDYATVHPNGEVWLGKERIL